MVEFFPPINQCFKPCIKLVSTCRLDLLPGYNMPLFNMLIFFLQTEFEKSLSVINQSYSIKKNRGIQVNHSRLVRETPSY